MFLACVSADASEKILPIAMEPSKNSRCFLGLNANELGFYYYSNKKLLMSRPLFYEFLFRFDSYIGGFLGRGVILLIDSCSAHGELGILLTLLNI